MNRRPAYQAKQMHQRPQLTAPVLYPVALSHSVQHSAALMTIAACCSSLLWSSCLESVVWLPPADSVSVPWFRSCLRSSGEAVSTLRRLSQTAHSKRSTDHNKNIHFEST